MPAELAQLTWVLALVWFIVYWIGGGVVFAVVALTRFLRIKKAQFSCLFTLASAAAGYGAAATGLMMSEAKAVRCLGGSAGPVEIAKAIFGCSVRDIFFAGGAWFALLVLLSILFMLLSQREGKPLTPKQ
ncbi:hypothetical protein HYS28_00300 [Candidatus Uhrbacteria bacterium]|nr:hypothetical protein [Candidatus Uhrbacteria bacterium]